MSAKQYDVERQGQGRRETDKCEIRCERMEDMQEQINETKLSIKSKPSWTGINIYMTLIIIIVLGAFSYVTISNAGLRTWTKEENERQDVVINKIIDRFDKTSDKLETLTILLKEHQASTERGRR